MRKTRFSLHCFAFVLLLAGTIAQAAPITGTVTNKTTNKPSAGDTVVLVDVQAACPRLQPQRPTPRENIRLSRSAWVPT